MQVPADTARLLDHIASLEGQLQEKDDVLEAIRSGDVDTVVVKKHTDGVQLYSLQSIDHPYRAFVQQIREGAVTLSEDGTMLYGNLGLATMLGISEEQVIGRQLQSFLRPQDTALLHQMLDQARHGGCRNELTLLSAEGNTVPVYVSFNFLRQGEDAIILCGIVTDLSEQKNHLKEMTEANTSLLSLAADLKRARDVAERANQAKTHFLTGVSHELRTPLNGILGYAQLLRVDAGLSVTHLAKVDAMMDAGTHLLHLISCVLDLSEIEAGHMMLQTTVIGLRRFASSCLELIRPMAAAKQLVLSLAVASNVPADILADPTRVRQVLFNLLGNAVKFTDQGAIELRLRSVTDGARLRIEVVDTGRGVPADQQHRLFQEFERLSTETTGPIEGAGLGLALSARVAALMGGQIGYDNNPGGGSIFWLELPVVANAAATPVWEAEDVPPAPASPRPLHVLVVDDIAMNRDIARSFLCVAGHRVVCVEGGREAVAAVAADDFDVVLMDIRMPEMDGLEATRRVRALEGPRGRVPIVALTAQAFSGQVEECREAGMDGHLGKPLALAVLLDTVERVAAAGQVANDEVSGAFMLAPIPGVSALAVEQPVINSALFAATAAVLSPEAVASYLRTLVEQGETLLHALRAPGALVATGQALAEAAHALAGSAGMFGFERLAATGRQFERAVQTSAAEAPVFATSLGGALQTALEEMRRREALVEI